MVSVKRDKNGLEVNEIYSKTPMNYTISLKATWKPVMTANTTNLEYWMHWQFFVCALGIFCAMSLASVLILKYDASSREHDQGDDESDDTLYADESWRPCLKEIHPAFFLFFRVVALCLMVSLLTINIILDGADMFFFYTQWTFTLVTTYFGLGSVLSIHGCCLSLRKGRIDAVPTKVDTERGSYVPPVDREGRNIAAINNHSDRYVRQKAGIWGHIFQVMLQTCAGAVMLTDCVYWCIIFPFLNAKDYDLNFIMITMHSINVVLLLVDTSLNCMWFPWYRIAYFILWTCVYVVFQWVIHACVSIWWPYPFLDLSATLAPLWYLFVGLLHIPCYALFFFRSEGKAFLFPKMVSSFISMLKVTEEKASTRSSLRNHVRDTSVTDDANNLRLELLIPTHQYSEIVNRKGT